MTSLRYTIAFALMVAIAGCVDLKTVRDFAGESAKFAANTELTTRFRDTYQREQPYVSGEAAQLARANDLQRKAAYQDLLKLHRNVAVYLQTLARLAGDKAFDVAKPLEVAASGLKAQPDFGIEGKQVDACLNLSKVVARWLTSGYQARAVRAMLKEGDPHLQTLLDGMSSLVGHCKRTNENERRAVLGLLEVEISYADGPKDLLLATLAKAHLQEKLQEYQRADAMFTEAEKGLQDIREGHSKLAEQADKLTGEEAKATVGALTKDLKIIRNNLQILHSW